MVTVLEGFNARTGAGLLTVIVDVSIDPLARSMGGSLVGLAQSGLDPFASRRLNADLERCGKHNIHRSKLGWS